MDARDFYATNVENIINIRYTLKDTVNIFVEKKENLVVHMVHSNFSERLLAGLYL